MHQMVSRIPERSLIHLVVTNSLMHICCNHQAKNSMRVLVLCHTRLYMIRKGSELVRVNVVGQKD